MKWWWMIGGIITVVLMEVNVRVYGGAATFGVPIGWMITLLVMTQFRKPTSIRRAVSFGVISVSIGIVLSVPSYSVAEAEETLDKTYNDVTYMESVPTTGGNGIHSRLKLAIGLRRGEGNRSYSSRTRETRLNCKKDSPSIDESESLY